MTKKERKAAIDAAIEKKMAEISVPAWPEAQQRDPHYKPVKGQSTKITAKCRNARAFGGKQKFKLI